MILMEEVSGSQQDFLRILQYGKDLYCKGKSPDLSKHWPATWQSAIKLLNQNGYKPPIEYFVCLNDSHPCCFDVLKSANQNCRFCHTNGHLCIKYSYLPLKDKIHRWCQDANFCHKMMAGSMLLSMVLHVQGIMKFGMGKDFQSFPGFGILCRNGHCRLVVLYVVL